MKSEIQKIHDQGMRAVIDGDRMLIVQTIKPEQVDRRVQELELTNESVGCDKDGDIIFYKEE